MKSFITIAFFSLFIADLFGQQTDPETLYSRKDGAFGVFSTWSTQSHEGAIAETTPGCSITGERSVVVADSIVTLCDRILISGNSNLVVANGGKLFLKGGLEVLGKSSVTVEKRGALYVGRNLIVSGDAKFKLDGDLTVNGNVEVNGHGFACGKGFSRLGGSVSGIGWCLDLNVLPIEILSIDARLEADEDVLLYWTSSIASETDDFIIERSNNGMSFVQIARVDGSTGGANETPYAYQDKGLKTGTYYYRLTQVDKTGGKEAEEIIAATIDRNMETGLCELQVDPNPCVPSCTVTLNDCPGSVFKTYIMVGSGRMISELVPVNTHRNDDKIQYHLNKDNFMMPGIYIIRAHSDASDVAKKLIIK